MLKTLFNGQLPQAVFFDLDGTLIDSVPDLASGIDQMLLACDLPTAGVEKVRIWVGKGARTLVERAVAASGEAGKAIDIDAAERLFLDFYASAAGHSTLYANVLELLENLHANHIPLVLITNKPQRFTPVILEQHKMDHLFEFVLCGDDLADKKPHPAQLLFALEKLNLEANKCLMVGDSISDIAAANAANVPSVAVTYGYNHGECATTLPATAFIDDLAELMI